MNKKGFLIILVLLFVIFCFGLNNIVLAAEAPASLRPPEDDDDDDDEYIIPNPTAPMNSPIRKDTQKPVIKDFSLTAPKLFKEVSNK